MYTVAALWGSLDKVSMKRTKPDAIFDNWGNKLFHKT